VCQVAQGVVFAKLWMYAIMRSYTSLPSFAEMHTVLLHHMSCKHAQHSHRRSGPAFASQCAL
jgi:hypothetical protein